MLGCSSDSGQTGGPQILPAPDASSGDSSDAAPSKTDTAVAEVQTGPVPLCQTDSDCPPTAIPCRTVYCDSFKVCNLKIADTAMTCNDGNACTAGDKCVNGSCTGTALNCEDNNPCTADLCLPADGCVHDPQVKPCETGDLCTLHACQGSKCVIANDKPCDDGNACTTDACAPASGCSHSVVTGAACDDGDSCTSNDACKFGQCKGFGKSCNDGNVCTNDGCDAAGNCTHAPNTSPCSDGDKCTTPDLCSNGACSGTAKKCADSSTCTDDFCNPLTGGCDAKIAADVTACDDGNPCTLNDQCAGLVCMGGQATECDDNNECTADACDPATGKCTASPQNDGQACGKANLCIANGTCKAGQCAGDQKVCDDQNPCTQDLCDPQSGLCTKSDLSDGTPCGNGKTCQSGVCF